MKEKAVIILRWIAILPGALIASTVIYWVVTYSQLFYADEKSMYAIHVVPVSAAFASGIALIYCGRWIAPSYKKHVSLVLLILSCLLMGSGIFSTFRNEEWQKFAEDLASVIGTVIAYVTQSSDETNLFKET